MQSIFDSRSFANLRSVLDQPSLDPPTYSTPKHIYLYSTPPMLEHAKYLIYSILHYVVFFRSDEAAGVYMRMKPPEHTCMNIK